MLIKIRSKPKEHKCSSSLMIARVYVPYPGLEENTLYLVYPKEYPITVQKDNYYEVCVDIQTHKNIAKKYAYLYAISIAKIEETDLKKYDNSVSIQGTIIASKIPTTKAFLIKVYSNIFLHPIFTIN